MVETIRYSLIGKSDVFTEPRNGQFEVELADGRRIVMSALDIAYLLSDVYQAESDLPGGAAAGQIARVLAHEVGFMFDGTNWAPLNRVPNYTSLTLPPAGVAGRLARIEKSLKLDDGEVWSTLSGLVASVSDYDAAGDGVTDDTDAVQAALDSGKPIIYFPLSGTHLIDQVTIPSTVRLITGSQGSTVKQKTVDRDLFTGTDISDLTIENLRLLGIAADRTASGNNGISITGSTSTIGNSARIALRHLYLKNWQHRGVHLRYVAGVTMDDCTFDLCSGGPLFASVTDAQISKVRVLGSQYSNFTTGISINTETNTPSSTQHNARVTLSQCLVRDMTAGQAYLVHDGDDVTLIGPQAINCQMGFGISPVGGGTQRLSRIMLVAPSYLGPTSGPSGSNVAIAMSGDGAGNRLAGITIIAPYCERANAVGLDGNSGAIMINESTDDLTLIGANIVGCYGVGIRIAGSIPNRRMLIDGYRIGNMIATPDSTRVGIFLTTGSHTGTIGTGIIDGVFDAIRTDVVCPDLQVLAPSMANVAGQFISGAAKNLLGYAQYTSILGQHHATGFSLARILPTYGPSIAIDAARGSVFEIEPTDAVAFTVANPTNPSEGAPIKVTIRNTTGGAIGAVTWDTLYKLAAWTQPAPGFSKTIEFVYRGTAWIEAGRTPADVPN